MSKTARIVFGLTVFGLLSGGYIADALQTEQDQQKMMEAYMKMMAVNENHDFLKNFEGDWDVTTTAWMQPGGEPTKTQNSASAGMIMGGRFLRVNFKGTMFGQPFE